MSISLTFLGAAQTVTGSKHLLEANGQRVLVDCGMFQGPKGLRERNWQDLPVPASSLAAVVLTHAHLDHSGWLPRLVSAGFSGRIFCTPGTMDLCKLVLPDAVEVRQLYQLAAEQNVQIRRLNHKRDSLEDIFLKAMEAPGGRL